MKLFSAQKIAEIPAAASAKRCRFCGQEEEILRVILDSDTGDSIQIFKCERCGERTWEE
jgi:transposase